MTPEPDAGTDHERELLARSLRTEAAAIAAVASALEGPEGEAWRRGLDLLEACRGHVVVSGMGKSGLVGGKISATLSSLGQPSNVVHPAEAVHGDLGRIRSGDVALLLSASGETEEVVVLAGILKADGLPRIGVSMRPESRLATLCDVHLSMGDVAEACPHNLAPTTSTTVMMAIGDALALALAARRNFAADDFHRHHPGGMLGVGMRPITEVLRFRVDRNLAVVEDGATAADAIRPSGEDRRAGAVLLVDAAGRLSGIFTDGDLRRLLNRDGAAGLDRPIREVMTPSPAHLTTAHVVRDAVTMVRERRLDEIPVVDAEGRPVGLLDVQDLVTLKAVRD
ncbi:MAG: KpsF/GutQ family sugar-phosphate isomerase [Planctomycetota bacterium]|jgi:arabinose-5-phosphate isomerase